MPDIRIEREHGLGLVRARQLAQRWAEEAEQRLSVRCEIEEGRSEDVVRFSRPGVNGRVRVTADRFELEASLGFLLAAFRGAITREVEAQVDAVLAKAPHPARATASREGGKAGAKAAGGTAARAPAKATGGTASKLAAAKAAVKATTAKKRSAR